MFISEAYAQQAGAAAGNSGTMQIVFMVAMFAILWFLMVRPQMKKAKEHKAMIEALQKGDEVISQGGMLGRIVKIGDNYVTLEIAEGVEVHVQKPAIGVVLPKGTIKAI
jgi:preprotein translocase subunit YajC